MQNNMPISFTYEFQINSNNSVLPNNNTFYMTPSSSVNNHSSSSLVASETTPMSGRNEIEKTIGYTTENLPEATASTSQHYETNFDADVPLSVEESRKNTRVIFKEKDIDLIQSSQKSTPTGNVQRACLVYHGEQYHLDNNLLSQPTATKYFVKVKTEISPGRYMAKLELQCSSYSKDHVHRSSNLDITQVTDAEQNAMPTGERRHFLSNINKTGHFIFCGSNLDCFSGSIQYPLPNKKAIASRIGYGGNAIVFVVFHAGKEFAVKKTLYRSEQIRIHSQLRHPNIINLDAVLFGEKDDQNNEYYVYYFMPKMDISFSNVLSTIEHGCLKQLVTHTDQELWELVLFNVKHILKSVLKALDYMHSQGLVHRDIKASNILIKMTCQCTDVLYCNCQRRKFLVQIGDFDSSATVPVYHGQPQIEEHQMIRYASVLPLGTMGYRAPEVSMHLVLSGPYEVLYATSVDIWSFGCLLLTIFIGKSEPLKQQADAATSYLWKQAPLLHELNQNIKEIQRCYFKTTGLCALVEKCLEVLPHCRPTAKQVLQSDFF